MGDDAKAHAFDDHPADLYNARKVIDVCPTAAISFSGEVPPPEDLSKLEEVPGWELEWAKLARRRGGSARARPALRARLRVEEHAATST
jgi:hypothetical protein